MARTNTYDLHNPTHFCFDLEAAYADFRGGYDELHVAIFPLESLCEECFCYYDDKDYCSPSGGIDFPWVPKSMLNGNGELDEIYECGFPFTGTPTDLEKELRALGMISLNEDRK